MKNISLVMILVLIFSFELDAQILKGFNQLELPKTPLVMQQIKSVHPGWTMSLDDANHVLKNITVYDGNPSELASLIPDKANRNRKEIYSVWYINSEQKMYTWIKCEFSGTSVTLSQPVPLGTKEIRVYYIPNIIIDGTRQIEKIL
jgi:hypothetical protein